MRLPTIGLALLIAFPCGAAPAAGPPPAAVAVRGGRFVDGRTGEPFAPRGFNYIRLFPGRGHSTFDPAHYDGQAIETAMARWRADGFNVVRVFLNARAGTPGSLAQRGREGLDPDYLKNVADFLLQARANRIAVVLTLEGFPRTAPYIERLERPQGVDQANAQYLADGHAAAKARFLKDLIRGLRAAESGCLEAVFSYDLQNELCYHGGPPFTLTSGTVATAEGAVFALPDERQELADRGAIEWIDRMAEAIEQVHPGALVGASVFTCAAVGRTGPGDFTVKQAAWQNRIPFRPLAILRSKADYLDLHFYSSDEAGLRRDLESVEFERVRSLAAERGKPLLVGEFGAFKRPFPEVGAAAAWMGSLAGLLVENGFAGWIYWTYDTHEQGDQLWHACDGGDAIYRRLRAAAR